MNERLERFLADLARRDIHLSLTAEGELGFDAPPGAMTDALKDSIRARKPDILAFLRAAGTRSAQVDESRAIPKAPEADSYPAGPAQRRLWFMDKLSPGNPFYNAPTALEIVGPLNETALIQALDALIARHEVLRTVLKEGDDGEPRQVVCPPCPMPFTREDLRSLPKGEREAQLAARADREARLSFDLSADPIARATLVTMEENRRVLLLTLHHIACDGWSIGVLMADLRALYAAAKGDGTTPPPPPRRQYRDVTLWWRNILEGSREKDLIDHWRRTLEDAPTTLPLPFDRFPADADAAPQGNAALVHPDAATGPALTNLARAESATLFIAAATAYAALLGRYTGLQDLLVGMAIANRHHEDLEGVVGLLVNTLPLRINLDDDPSFRTLLRRTRDVVMTAFDHQDLPFDQLVQALRPDREAARTPLVQAVLVVQNTPPADWKLSGLTVRPLPLCGYTARNDLELHLWEAPQGLMGLLYYDANRFSDERAGQLAEHMGRILDAMAQNPDAPALGVPLAELENATTSAVEEIAPVPPLLDQIAARVQAQPDAPALEADGETLSYATMWARTGMAARRLLALEGNTGEENDIPPVVGLRISDPLDAVVTLLACWRAGLAHMPLGPDDPPARIEALINEAKASLVVTDRPLPDGSGTGNLPWVTPAALLEKVASDPALPSAAPAGDRLAYILFTSGSTGTPKGVMIAHRGLATLARSQAKVFAMTETSRVLQFAPLTFDASISEIAVTLAAGATLVLAERAALTPGPPLAKLLDKRVISVVTLPPSILAVLAHEDYPALKTLVVAGEALPADLANRWMVPGRRLVNAYGPTECTVCATMHVLAEGFVKQPPPIGRPMDGITLRLLDRRGQPVPPGAPGEIHLGGKGLALGYLNQPEETAARFRADPFDPSGQTRLYATGDLARADGSGSLSFLGRADGQVKLRGMRVETGEIEARLRALPEIVDAAVVVAGREAQRLAAFVVPAPQNPEKDAAARASHLDDWRTVFDDVLKTAPESDDPLFNHAGWTKGENGDAFSDWEMEAWRSDVVAHVLERAPRAVLELGCGTGMILWPIAPHVARYRGIDISPEAVDYIAAQAELNGNRFHGVEVAVGTAEDPPGVTDESFDLVMLHSVVQYFPDQAYFRRVLDRAARALRPGGAIVLGDLRNQALARIQASEAVLDSADEGTPAEAARQAVAQRLDREAELLVDPGFLVELVRAHPLLSTCRFRLQRGSAPNELNRYRYTAVLEACSADIPQVPAPPVWEGGSHTLDDIRARLISETPDAVVVEELPNGLLHSLVTMDRSLHGEARTTGEAQAAYRIAESENTRLPTPESLQVLAGDLGYKAVVSWGRDPGDGTLCVAFHRPGQPEPLLPLSLAGRVPSAVPLINSPLSIRPRADLAHRCHAHLSETLPAHMVPPVIEVRDALPLTPHGKVNRARLIQWAETANRRRQPPEDVGPIDPLTQKVAAVFAETLELRIMGADDNFFDLGGHSLLAVTLANRLSERLGAAPPLAALIGAPTPGGTAALLAPLLDQSGKIDSYAPSPLLTRLGGGEAGSPLFLFPPAAGSPLCYLDFAMALGGERPIWGLRCPGLEAGETRITSVAALGECFAEAIRTVQPHGPYWLAGWSFGGMPAAETARLLEKEGEVVAFLGLLDSGLSMSLPATRGKTVARKMQELMGLFAMALQVGRIRRFEDIRRLAQAAGISLPRTWSAARRPAVWKQVLDHALRSVLVFKANMAAAKRHDVGELAAPVTLLRAAPPMTNDPILTDIRARTGSLGRIRHVEGNHMTIMLLPKQTRDFAAIVADELARASHSSARLSTPIKE